MAKQVLLAAYVEINSVDVSSNVSKCELTIEVEDKETTTFGSSGWAEVLGGIKSGELSLTFKQDMADDGLDEDIFALLGTVVTFEVRISNAAVGASNPSYSGSVLVNSWAPVNGSVGDVAEVEVGWPTSGAITRATS